MEKDTFYKKLSGLVLPIGLQNLMTALAGIFCAGGDTGFGLLCDGITMWMIVIPVGMAAAFWFKAPVLRVYFLLNLDEFVKLPAVFRHYKQYKWVRNLTKTEGGSREPA